MNIDVKAWFGIILSAVHVLGSVMEGEKMLWVWNGH